MAEVPVLSCDGHVNEPPELWERVPSNYRSRVPHRELIDGIAYMVTEGQRPRRLDDEDRPAEGGERLTAARAGGWDPAFRVKDMERDGVSGEVIYPGNFQSAGYFETPDPEFGLVLARAYNDWAMEVYGAYPDRFVPAAVIPVRDVSGAVSEIQRAAKMGYRALFLPVKPVDVEPYNAPRYDSLWAAIEGVGLPCGFHAASGYGDSVVERGAGGMMINYWYAVMQGQSICAYLATSGILMRFPKMHVVAAECSAGWLAWQMHVLDESYQAHFDMIRPKLDMLPSEYIKRQFHCTFQHDPVAVTNRHVTGLDALMWGNDYPHPEGTWPYSRQAIADEFKGVPENEMRQILFGNAAKLYGFDKYLDKSGMPKSFVGSRR